MRTEADRLTYTLHVDYTKYVVGCHAALGAECNICPVETNVKGGCVNDNFCEVRRDVIL